MRVFHELDELQLWYLAPAMLACARSRSVFQIPGGLNCVLGTREGTLRAEDHDPQPPRNLEAASKSRIPVRPLAVPSQPGIHFAPFDHLRVVAFPHP